MSKASWLGPPIDELHGRKMLKDCQTNSGECITTGDYVHLIPADPCMEKYVGRIESMYEDESSSKCIQVRWFYRPQDLQHEPPLQPLENEVYHTSYYDCQLVQSVIGRCMVIHKREYLSTKTRNSSTPMSEDQMDVYPCGYSYSAELGQFVAIQEEDLAGSVSNLPYVDGKESGSGNIGYEDIAVARQLANALLEVDRSVPREVAKADWSTAKRLPWVLRAKNAMTLEDLKRLLIDLESGLEIFKHQKGWRKRVHTISSFDMLNRHIQYLKHNAQQKVDDSFKKLRRTHSDKQIRKPKSISMPRGERHKWRAVEKGCQSDRQESFKKIIMGSSFAIDQSRLPPKCLRVVMGATSNCRPEKRPMEDQMDELWKSVEVMQDDVAVVLDSMGFSQAMLPMQSSEPGSNDILALTDKYDPPMENTSKENILLFQMAAQGVSCKGGSSLGGDHTATNDLSSPISKQHSVMMETASLTCFSAEKQVLSPKEEQEGCGFRVWKPDSGSFASPGARNMACFQTDANKQINVSRPVLV